MLVAWVALAAGGSGCAGDRSCDALVRDLCRGKSTEECAVIRSWLERRLEAPDGERLPRQQESAACEVILNSHTALAWYRSEVEKLLLSTPAEADEVEESPVKP